MDLPRTIVACRAALESGEISALEVVEACITRADESDASLGAYLRRFDAIARSTARALDIRRRNGGHARPLDGIPIAVKDNIVDEVSGATAQSLVPLAGPPQPPVDATAVSRLRKAGAIIMGKTTTMEFALGLPDPTKPFPIPRNPWDLNRWAGGSSSGSAAGTAAGLFLGAIGTDTAGSIRIPAAFTGVTGLKPTLGLVPSSGVIPLSYTQDHVGPLARTAEDCAVLLSVLTGDVGMSTSTCARRYEDGLPLQLDGITIGFDDLDRFADNTADRAAGSLFQAAVDQLAALGATVRRVKLPCYQELLATNLVITLAEAASIHRQAMSTKAEELALGTRVMLSGADAIGSADYVHALRARRSLFRQVMTVFNTVDIVVTPVGHSGAPSLASISGLHPLTATPSLHTPYWNPLGLPVLSIPMGFGQDGTPMGLSIAGPPFTDRAVLGVGHAYQTQTGHHITIPQASDTLPGLQRPPVPGKSDEQRAIESHRAAIRDMCELIGAMNFGVDTQPWLDSPLLPPTS